MLLLVSFSGDIGSIGGPLDWLIILLRVLTPLAAFGLLDVLNEDNAALYWGRDSRYDTVLNLNFAGAGLDALRSEEHTSELQSLMRISYAVFFLTKKHQKKQDQNKHIN